MYSASEIASMSDLELAELAAHDRAEVRAAVELEQERRVDAYLEQHYAAHHRRRVA